jgi:hypothetical protein
MAGDADEVRFDTAVHQWWATVEQATRIIPATSPEGRRIKIVMLAAVLRDILDDYPAHLVALALVRDLAGGAVA